MNPDTDNSSINFTLVAPAKVNLFLHITGRRPDGYHEIESLFAFTRHGDTLRFHASDLLEFTLDGPFAGRLKALGGDGPDNLVLRAAHALARASDRAATGAIHLSKNLPVEGGIGGGSADAAATLKGLNRLWGLNWPMEKLAEIGFWLGADVPACLHGRPAMVRGIGEHVSPVRLSWQAGIVLVNAGRGSPTPQVFGAYREQGLAFDLPLADADASVASLGTLACDTRNSLETPAIHLNPAIAGALAALGPHASTLFARMSGSGSTCFALCASVAEAEAVAATLQADHPAWWVMADELVSD